MPLCWWDCWGGLVAVSALALIRVLQSVRAWRSVADRSLRVPAALAELAPGLLLIVALLMAALAGQRWSVDHYLPYQQPYLFAAMVCLLPAAPAWRWPSTAVVLLCSVSLLLFFIRYPATSRQTYVRPWPGGVASSPLLAGDAVLCAPQHAGPEWRGSRLWGFCHGFEDSGN
jgi:hypothetical protein